MKPSGTGTKQDSKWVGVQKVYAKHTTVCRGANKSVKIGSKATTSAYPQYVYTDWRKCMTNSNALRMWGISIFALTICLLALLIDDQVNIKAAQVQPAAETTTTSSTSTTSTTIDLSFLTPPTPPVVSTPPAAPTNTDAFFECIRWRESRGNYQAISGSGTFMGAYQFYQEGWDTFAARINRHDLVGVPPHQAAPADQDAVALAAYNELGSQPWGGACG